MPVINLEWAHVVIGGVSAVVGAAGGLIAGVWRVAHIEQDIRSDFAQELAEATHEIAEKLTVLTSHFDETFRGLRQKINDVELNTEKNFVNKPDFDDFRREYREDMRDLKGSIAQITRSH